jgi:transcriptional regulator with XRE-family HTH domain
MSILSKWILKKLKNNKEGPSTFAKRIGIHPSEMSRILKSKPVGSVKTFKKISKGFNVPFCEFIHEVRLCDCVKRAGVSKENLFNKSHTFLDSKGKPLTLRLSIEK